jgi:hypothetical protein
MRRHDNGPPQGRTAIEENQSPAANRIKAFPSLPSATPAARPSRARHPWSAAAPQAIQQLAASGKPFTSDNVRDVAGDPPEPRLMGAVLSGARSKRIAQPVAAVLGRNGRPLRLWVRTHR